MDALVLEDAEVRISGKRVLGPLSLTVGVGECWVLLGPNGSGKTTFLSLAGARRQPSAGRVAVLGEWLGSYAIRDIWPRIGHVSHRLADSLGAGLSVEDVVLTGRDSALVTWLQDFERDDLAEADRLLKEAGCAELAGQRFRDCSLGERQRVLIARARFGVPDMLLLDEPAAGIDLPGREALVAATETACRDGATVLMATHHLEEIPPSATHALLLHNGHAVEAGEIEEVLRPGALAACFGMAISVERRDGRWFAAAAR